MRQASEGDTGHDFTPATLKMRNSSPGVLRLQVVGLYTNDRTGLWRTHLKLGLPSMNRPQSHSVASNDGDQIGRAACQGCMSQQRQLHGYEGSWVRAGKQPPGRVAGTERYISFDGAKTKHIAKCTFVGIRHRAKSLNSTLNFFKSGIWGNSLSLKRPAPRQPTVS
ncbi:hypothetical protein LZ30DRAFT_439840 [Colletotrichum cereale]|nr:hypothetical protein LZ30DRAFT_439840 [Colletotrichum cereale]